MTKTAIVIGAGACGLAALKELRTQGIDASTYEVGDKVGGVFANFQPHYNLTISNHLMAFSDFPAHKPLSYSFLKDYLEYLNLYVSKFGLLKYIHFHTYVKNCKLNAEQKWVVQLERTDPVTKEVTMETRIVDVLVVASGAHMKPNIPDLTGFTGDVIHSQNWNLEKESIREKKQRALVIGIGESSADIIEDTSRLAAHTTVFSRRVPLLASRFLTHPEKECSSGKVYPVVEYLETYTTGRAFSEVSMRNASFGLWVKWHLMALDPHNHFNQGAKWMLENQREHPIRNECSGFVCKNAKLAECVQAGTVDLVVSKSAVYNGKSVRFSNGKTIDVDVIVLCTGFEISFPFLDIPNFTASPRDWFKHSVPPVYGDKLFFVGFGRPHQGGIPGVGEMQARYISLLVTGQRTLPNNYEQLIRNEAQQERDLYVDSPNLLSLVDYPSLMNSLADLVGCQPQLPLSVDLAFYSSLLLGSFTYLVEKHLNLVEVGFAHCNVPFHISKKIIDTTKENVGLFAGAAAVLYGAQFLVHDGFLTKYLFYPNWPVWYRRSGPNAKPEILDEVLAKFPLSNNILPSTPSLVVVWHFFGVIVGYPITKVTNALGAVLRKIGLPQLALSWGTPRHEFLHGNKTNLIKAWFR